MESVRALQEETGLPGQGACVGLRYACVCGTEVCVRACVWGGVYETPAEGEVESVRALQEETRLP